MCGAGLPFQHGALRDEGQQRDVAQQHGVRGGSAAAGRQPQRTGRDARRLQRDSCGRRFRSQRGGRTIKGEQEE